MYSRDDRFYSPMDLPGDRRRFEDIRPPSSGRHGPVPREMDRPRDRRSLEMDRRGRGGRDGPPLRHSEEFDYDYGHQPIRSQPPPERHGQLIDRRGRQLERQPIYSRAEEEDKRQIAEELKMREKQLAITSKLLEKQSMMLKNMEVQNQMMKPNMMMGGNMGPLPMGRNMGPPRLGPPPRHFEGNPDQQQFRRGMDSEGTFDGPPPPKRIKDESYDDKSNWKKAMRLRSEKSGRDPVAKKRCNYCRRVGHIKILCPDREKGLPPAKDSKDYKTFISTARDIKSPKKLDTSPQLKDDSRHSPSARHTDRDSKPPMKRNLDSRRPVKKGFGARPFKRDLKSGFYKGKSGSHAKACKVCCLNYILDFQKHKKDPDHLRKKEVCFNGCKLCCKKRHNSILQHDKHQVNPLHKVLVDKKKKVVEAKLKPYSANNTSGVEYVVPVSGFFCKLCKKFYNKEAYAKVDHCKTKPHYEKVAALLGAKYETAIGARFQDIKDKLSEEVIDPELFDRKLIETVRKADFVTDLKPLPAAPKVAVKPKEASEKQNGDDTKETTKSKDEQSEEDEKPEEDGKRAEDEDEKTTEDEDEDHEHPDDLEMKVIDDVGEDHATVE